jgi:hypothetical protein
VEVHVEEEVSSDDRYKKITSSLMVSDISVSKIPKTSTILYKDDLTFSYQMISLKKKTPFSFD